MGTNKEGSRRERIRRFITRQIHSKARSRIDSSDIVSQAELALWLGGHDNCQNESTNVDNGLLRVVAKRSLAKEIRFQSRNKRDFRCDEPLGNTVGKSNATSDMIVEQQELFTRINLEIKKLGEIYWRIYHLRFFCDATLAEIGSEVGLSRRKLDAHLKTLYAHIKQQLSLSNMNPVSE